MPYPDYPCTKCNSWIDPPPGTKKGMKFICPRCDDRVTWFGPDIPEDAVVSPPIKMEVTERKKNYRGKRCGSNVLHGACRPDIRPKHPKNPA